MIKLQPLKYYNIKKIKLITIKLFIYKIFQNQLEESLAKLQNEYEKISTEADKLSKNHVIN